MSEKLNISPEVDSIRSERNRNLGWEKALAELIDNAFDAKANQVRITCKGRIVEVLDDGHGVKDLSATVTRGKHRAGEYTALGMYGVGLKDAWHWAGHRMEVETVHGQQRGILIADSQEMMRNNTWDIEPPLYSPATCAPFTKVTLHLSQVEPRRSLPTFPALDQLRWIFTPALLTGKQIIHISKVPSPLIPYELPSFSSTQSDTFHIEGREVKIRIGIVEAGQRMLKGPIWLQYGHRNIKPCSLGCKGYSTDYIGGIVALGRGWNLSSNKDDLTDYSSELNEEIFLRIEHLLKDAEQLTLDVENAELQSELETQFNEAMRVASKTIKEKRPGHTDQTGTVEPRLTGVKRRKSKAADPTKDGSVDTVLDGVGSGKRKTGTHIAFGDLEGDMLGAYDSLSNRVTLNRNHAFIIDSRAAKNITVLNVIAFSLVCHLGVTTLETRQKELWPTVDFSKEFGRVLTGLSSSQNVGSNEQV